MGLSFRKKLQWGATLARAASRAYFGGDKRALADAAARIYEQEGEMLKLDVDSEGKQVRVEVKIKGQPKPLEVRGVNYRVIGEPGAKRIVFERVELSEKWLEPVANILKLAEKGAPIPPEQEGLIEMVL